MDGSYAYRKPNIRYSDKRVVFKDTILYSLFTNPEYRSFALLLAEVPALAALLNSTQTNMTIFVPKEGIPQFNAIDDSYELGLFIKKHMFNGLVGLHTLQQSSCLVLKNNLANQNAYISGLSTPSINGKNILPQELIGNNSVIYLIDYAL